MRNSKGCSLITAVLLVETTELELERFEVF